MRAKHHRNQHRRQRAAILIVPLVMLVATGCSGPRYEKARFERDARIRDTWQLAQDREDRNAENFETLGALHQSAERHRPDWAGLTRSCIRKDADEDLRWYELHHDRWHRWHHRLYDGRPESIRNAWADMTY